MKDGGGKGGIRSGSAGFRKDFEKIFGLTCAAGSDHRNLRGLADGAGQGAIEAGLHAVGVHGSEQDFTGSELLAAAGPFDRVDAFVVAASARVDVPAMRAASAGVDG